MTAAPATARRAGGAGHDVPVAVLGVPFTLCSFAGAVERIQGLLEGGGPHQVVLANAHTLNLAYADESYRRVLKAAALVLRDGVGVEVALRLAGERPMHNFVGTDFVPRLLAALAPLEVRVFLFGGELGVADTAGRALARQAPNVRVVGTAPGYGTFARVVQEIGRARPQVLLVALGNPLQERWIHDNLTRLNVPVAIGVGALFDYLAGRVPRAPRWVLRLRAEWLFRLAIEPRRLWRRYVVGNPRFLWRVARSHGRKAW